MMILSKNVLIKRAGNTKLKYYSNLGYDIKDKEFIVEIKDLLPSSKIIIKAKCGFCSKIVDIKYSLYFLNIQNGNIFSCSKKCSYNKTKETNIEKYGYVSANKNSLIKEKKKNTNIEKYGVEYPSQSDKIKKKTKETNIKKYGVEFTFQSDLIKSKSKNTLLKNYGVDHNFKSKKVIEKSKNTLLKNYGVENPSKSLIIQTKKLETIKLNKLNNSSYESDIEEKKKNTNRENLGVNYPMQSLIVKEKSKKTLLKKYGVDHNSKSDIVKNNLKTNNLKNWGVEYTLQSPIIRNNIKETNIEKYGVDHPLKSDSFRKDLIISNDSNYIKYIGDNISQFKCDKGHIFTINSSNYFSRKGSNIPLCTTCHPIGSSSSIKELELLSYIKSIYKGGVISSYRDQFEIDIYLPDLNLGFEFNGLYWHSEVNKSKNYHLEKTNWFKEKGIRIIHIWEDDWDYKRDIVKSMILNRLGKNNQKIYGRKCIIKEVSDNNIIRNFLEENHIQGYCPNQKKVGLYYKDNLVSLMCFNKFEGRKKLPDSEWNLSRFCNLKNTNVIGGASKLIKYFIDNYNPSRIISYADKDWSIGNLYYQMGFSNIKESNIDYKYIIDDKRIHKQNFKKSNLKLDKSITESDYMKSNNYFKIWDCGKIKFEKLFNI